MHSCVSYTAWVNNDLPEAPLTRMDSSFRPTHKASVSGYFTSQ